MMPILMLAPMPARAAGGAVSVGFSALAGNDIGGTIGTAVAAATAVVGLVLTVIAMNRKNRREYDQEIQAAEERGAREAADRINPLLTQAQRDAEFYRSAYFSRFGPTQPLVPPPGPGEQS